jgi:hypothetical protein
MSQNILLVAIFAALFLLSFAAFGMQRTTLLMSREADVPSEIGALLVRSKNRLRLSNCVTYRPPRQIGRLAPAESLGESDFGAVLLGDVRATLNCRAGANLIHCPPR